MASTSKVSIAQAMFYRHRVVMPAFFPYPYPYPDCSRTVTPTEFAMALPKVVTPQGLYRDKIRPSWSLQN
ncbi:MAG: hypothetical protein WA970_24320 [Gammaproteobacteria bacterium]